MSMHPYPVFDVSDTYLVFNDEVTIDHIAGRYVKAFLNDDYNVDEGFMSLRRNSQALMALKCNPDVVYDSYVDGADSIGVRYKYGEQVWEQPLRILAVPIDLVDDTWCEVLFGTKNPYWADIIGHIGSFKFVRIG